MLSLPPLPQPLSASELTIYIARKIITMEPALPEATAVVVAQGRIVAVGRLDSIQGWTKQRGAVIDRQFEDKILMPGFVDTAWIMDYEDEIGSIQAGEKADLAVLEQNPYEVATHQLKSIPVWGVILEGPPYAAEL